MENNFYSGGTVFYSSKRKEFFQVREPYFDLRKEKDNTRIVKGGHFAKYLNDAKNDMPFDDVTVGELKGCVNIEERGLLNIPGIFYDRDEYDWRPDVPPIQYCSYCGQPIK